MTENLIYFQASKIYKEIREYCIFYHNHLDKCIRDEDLNLFLEINQKCEKILQQIENSSNTTHFDYKNKSSQQKNSKETPLKINQAILQGYTNFCSYTLGIDAPLANNKTSLSFWQNRNPYDFLLNIDNIYFKQQLNSLMIIQFFIRILNILKQKKSFFYYEKFIKEAFDIFLYQSLS